MAIDGDDFAYEAPSTPSEPVEPEPDPPRNPRESAWRGAKAGARVASFVGVPIGVVLLLPGLAAMAFGVGVGEGLSVAKSLIQGLAIVAGFAVGGGLVGALLGWFSGRRRQAEERVGSGSFWDRLHRPIRLRPKQAGEWPTARRRRPRGSWRLLAWLVGVPALLTVVVGIAAGVVIGRQVEERVEAAIEAADRDDPNWRLDDLMRSREWVPDEENSAIVVDEALAMVPEGWPKLGPQPWPGGMQTPPSELDLAWERLEGLESNDRLDEWAAETLRDERDSYAEAVALLRTVADYERGRHELEIEANVIDTLLPETQASRTAARLLQADAAIRAHEGDLDGALESTRAILGVGRSIGDEPFLISNLVRIAIGSAAMQSARRMLGQGEPSDEAIGRLQEELQAEWERPLELSGIRGERAMMVELLRRVADGEIPLDFNFYEPGDPVPGVASWMRVALKYQIGLMLELTNSGVEIAKLPPHERLAGWEAWEARIEFEREDWHAPYTKTFAILMTPALQSSGMAHLRYQAELGAMVILLAAERHRLRHGEWPGAIGAIDPDLLPESPIDPFSGEEYRVHRPEGRFIVASIGPNGEDDGGEYLPKTWMNGGPDDVGGTAWEVGFRGQAPPPIEPGFEELSFPDIDSHPE